jgi:hypothetical protein
LWDVDRKKDNEQLNNNSNTGTFEVAGGECCFIRPKNMGRNHSGNDGLEVSV